MKLNSKVTYDVLFQRSSFGKVKVKIHIEIIETLRNLYEKFIGWEIVFRITFKWYLTTRGLFLLSKFHKQKYLKNSLTRLKQYFHLGSLKTDHQDLSISDRSFNWTNSRVSLSNCYATKFTEIFDYVRRLKAYFDHTPKDRKLYAKKMIEQLWS